MQDLIKNNDYRNFKFLFKNSKNLFSGKYFSKLKGQGVEFCDLKVYDFSDDVRKIDWNVTARMNEPYVREFLEEKDSTHYFLIDISGSIFNKIYEIKKLVAMLLFVCNHFGDNFSIVFARKDFMKVVPVSKGKKHLFRCIYEISQIKEKSYGDLDVGLKFLLNNIKKNSLVSIFSDELDISFETLSYISALRKKNKVIFFEFFNSNELEFDLGLEVFSDSESGEEVMYDLDDDEIYEIILNFNNKLNNVSKVLRKSGVKVFCFDTKDCVVESLRREAMEL